jgi:hypothetical protein
MYLYPRKQRPGFPTGKEAAVMRIEYRPVPGRVMPFYSVWVAMPAPQTALLVGFVSLEASNWTARRRSDAGQAMSGWPRRSDAAAWLLIAGEFAQRRQMAA